MGIFQCTQCFLWKTDVTLGQAVKLTHTFISLAKYIIYFRKRFSDFKFTSRFTDAGETVAIIDVLVRPPRESWRILVSLDSRYGIWGALSTRAVITLPSVSRDWLIFPASRALLSTAPDRPMFSLPARSTWKAGLCFCLKHPKECLPQSLAEHIRVNGFFRRQWGDKWDRYFSEWQTDFISLYENNHFPLIQKKL